MDRTRFDVPPRNAAEPEGHPKDDITGGSAAASGSEPWDDDIAASDAGPAAPTDEEVAIGDKAWEIRFRIGISRRYNSRLASHYGGLENFATVLSLVGGSAAFADALGKQTGLALYASLTVMVAATVSLAFRWPDKARSHTDFYRQYTRLQERLVRAGENPSDETIREIEADLTLIEAGEPATRNALMIVCHNEEVTAQKADPSHKQPLRWWQRWFAAFVTLPPRTWESA